MLSRRRLASSGFHPAVQLAGQLRAWWNADDLVDGVVASWVDRINGINVSQATGAAQPIKSVGAFRGKSGVTFDGVDDVLSLTGVPATLPTGNSPSSIWIVGSDNSIDTTGRRFFSYGDGSVGGGRSIGTLLSTLMRIGVNTGAGFAASNSLPSAGSHLYMGKFSEGGPAIKQDGPHRFNRGAVNFTTTTTRVVIGASAAATAAAFLAGVIRHILIFTDLTPREEEFLEGWLMWESGLQGKLPTSHPFRWRRP